MRKKKKLEALSKKQSERKRNWKLSHATAWRWQATMIYGILETETELRRKRNTVKTRVCNHKITWLIYNGILFKYQHIRNQVPSYRVGTVVSLRFKSQLIAVKQTCNWLSRRMTLEERMVNAWRQMVNGIWWWWRNRPRNRLRDTKLARTTFHTERSIDSSLVGRTK